MAKKSNRVYKSLVNKKIGSDEKGNPRFVFEVGKPVEGLAPKQIKYYKQIKYIE